VIDLAVAANELRLVISDDGVGLANAGTDGKGMGLQTMDYRARMVGGELTVRPGERGGTTVTCVVSGQNIGESIS